MLTPSYTSAVAGATSLNVAGGMCGMAASLAPELALKGDTGVATLDEASVRDPAFSAMRHRVTVSEDPAMTAALPDHKQARVTMLLKDGRRSTGICDNPRGDLLHPYGEAEIRAKFHQLSEATLRPDGARRIELAIDALDRMDDMTELIALLRAAAR
jgi:2-methylcitrate dehydratase PrpD